MYTEVIGYMTAPETNGNAPQRRVKTKRDKRHGGKLKRLIHAVIACKYYILQKISGLFLIAIGILSIYLSDGDGTACIFLALMGLFLIFTKEKVMMFEGWKNKED